MAPSSVYIRNPNTGKLLTISGGMCSSGTAVVLWQNYGYDYQKWRVNGDGSLESVHCPSMVMDTASSSCSGKFVEINNKGNLTSQVWAMDANDFLRPVACNTGKVLDIRQKNTTDGAEIIVYGELGSWNQKWEFLQVP